MTLFTKTGSGYGYGYGEGDGDGYGSVDGNGYGYGNGYSNGAGDGFGDGIITTDVWGRAVRIDEFGLGVVRFGCQTQSIDWWRENWSLLAVKHGVYPGVAKKALAEVVKFIEGKE